MKLADVAEALAKSLTPAQDLPDSFLVRSRQRPDGLKEKKANCHSRAKGIHGSFKVLHYFEGDLVLLLS